MVGVRESDGLLGLLDLGGAGVLRVQVQGLGQGFRHHSRLFGVDLDASEAGGKVPEVLFGCEGELVVLPHVPVLLQLRHGHLHPLDQPCQSVLAPPLRLGRQHMDLLAPPVQLALRRVHAHGCHLDGPLRLSDGLHLKRLELGDDLDLQRSSKDRHLLGVVFRQHHLLLQTGQHGVDLLGVLSFCLWGVPPSLGWTRSLRPYPIREALYPRAPVGLLPALLGGSGWL